MPVEPGNQPVARIGFLEGLRGYLAIWVMLVHVGYFVGLSRFNSEPMFPGFVARALSYLDLTGYDAVKLFMILSGFVIFYLLDQGRESYAAFIVRRFFRLWPIFAACVALGVLTNPTYIEVLQRNAWSQNFWIRHQCDVAKVIQANPLPYLAVNATMMHGVVPKAILPNASAAFSSLSWCISAEWQFYLLAPLLYAAMRRLWGASLLTALVVAAVAFEHSFDFWINPTHSFLPMQIHWFFTGLASYLIYREIRGAGLNGKTRLLIALLICFMAAVAILQPRDGLAMWLWLPVFGVLIDSVTTRRSPAARLLLRLVDNPVSRYFGRISYPIYLLHWPAIIVAVKALMVFAPQSSWLVAEVILLVAVSALTWPLAHLAHHYLEAPAMDFGKRVAAMLPKRAPTLARSRLVSPKQELSS